MNFHNLEYFLTITKEKNISKAAEQMHISQQSLSEQLKKLETELGVTLINRGNPLSLTAAGEVFQRHALRIFGAYNTMLDELDALLEKDSSNITLAIPSTEMPAFLPGLLTDFTRDYPDISIKVIRIEPREAGKRANDFDLYFSTLPLGTELDHVPVDKDETFAVAFSKSLARKIYGDYWDILERELIEKQDIYWLRDMPFVIMCNQADEMVLDQQIIFQGAGFQPKVEFRSDNSELNTSMCRLGIGVYISRMGYFKRKLLNTPDSEDIMVCPIRTPMDPVMIVLSHRKGKVLKKSERTFISAARKYLKEK